MKTRFAYSSNHKEIAICLWIITFLFTIILGRAQQVTNKVQIDVTEAQMAIRPSFNKVIGSDESGTYVERVKTKQDSEKAQDKIIYIDHVNKNMNVDYSFQIPKNLKYKKRRTQFLSAVMLKGNLYYLWTEHQFFKFDSFLLLQKVDKQTLQPNGDFIEILPITYNFKKYDYTISPNEEKIMFVVTSDSGIAKEATQFDMQIKVYDFDMKLAWSNNTTLPISKAKFSVNHLSINDDGEGYIIGFNRQSITKKDIDDTYSIFHFDREGKTFKEIPIGSKNKMIVSAFAITNNDGNTVITGFYNDLTTSLTGVFYRTVDSQTDEIITDNFFQLEKNFVDGYFYMNILTREITRSIAANYIKVQEDGEITLITEQLSLLTSSVSFDHILVINFNRQGEINWKCNIPKRQKVDIDKILYASFRCIAINDKLYFIYNDNLSNLSRSPDEKMADMTPFFGNPCLVLAEVDEKGQLKRELLIDSKQTNLIARPASSGQTGKFDLFVFSQKRWKYQYTLIHFK